MQREELRLLTGVKKKTKIKKLFNRRIEMEIELMEFKRSEEFKICRKEGRKVKQIIQDKAFNYN